MPCGRMPNSLRRLCSSGRLRRLPRCPRHCLPQQANSRLDGKNRVETCRQCHANAVKNFADFDPHADPKNAEKYPELHQAFGRMEILIFSLLAFFFVHTCLWLLRSLVQVLQHGRDRRLKTNQRAIIRFTRVDRLFHGTAIFSLLGLSATGLVLKYDDQRWTNAVAKAVGGFRVIGAIHLAFAGVAVCFCVGYITTPLDAATNRQISQAGSQLEQILFGPDSLVPNMRDLSDLMAMLGWFFGLAKKPVFERWTYWEKFSYWAIAGVMVIVGMSGLMIWQPNLFARVVSGEALNWAQMTHAMFRWRPRISVGNLLLQHPFSPREIPHGLVVPDGTCQ